MPAASGVPVSVGAGEAEGVAGSGVGVSAGSTRDEDFLEDIFVTSTHSYIMFFTNKGRAFRIKCYSIPEASRTAKGTPIVNLLQLQTGEFVTAAFPIGKELGGDEGYLVMCTRQGIIKKTPLRDFANIRKGGIIAQNLKEGDELISVELSGGSDEFIIGTREGKSIRFSEEDVRAMGRAAAGVRAIKLDEGDAVVDMSKVHRGEYVIAIAENGMGKRTDEEEYRQQGRAGKGIIAMNITEKTGKLIPWHKLDGGNKNAAALEALQLLADMIDKALEAGRYVGKPFKEDFPLLEMPKLRDVDLSPTLTDEEYREQLKKLQKRLGELHNVIYRKKIPVILCYEGWDAAGKGGNIRRIAKPLDPRGFDVMPIASPEPHELNRQYLWRFWKRLPRTGHICIFDRTWYGRVMVERLEGFCSEKDWKRAYNEINEFERQLTDWGAVVIKFWIHIDQDTQLARFTERQNTPEKQWKITDEDWRNREKWDQYEVAVDEMLQKTSTKNAPWYIIESNDKKYARIRTLKIIVKALEKACQEHFEQMME